jgi:hypothetical protein
MPFGGKNYVPSDLPERQEQSLPMKHLVIANLFQRLSRRAKALSSQAARLASIPMVMNCPGSKPIDFQNALSRLAWSP